MLLWIKRFKSSKKERRNLLLWCCGVVKVIFELSKEKLKERWKILLKCFISLGVLSPQRSDQATI